MLVIWYLWFLVGCDFDTLVIRECVGAKVVYIISVYSRYKESTPTRAGREGLPRCPSILDLDLFMLAINCVLVKVPGTIYAYGCHCEGILHLCLAKIPLLSYLQV